MACASSLLSEEQFLCSICLDVFTDPVTIQCGHNFCLTCITQYWDSNDQCQCPMCKKNFDKRPDIFVNTFISKIADQFKKSIQVNTTDKPKSIQVNTTQTPKQQPALQVQVPCDVCTGAKLNALKSCLVCLASFCETHLEPHQRVAPLKKHKLIDPVENLEDRMCEKHSKLLELFCRTDQTCVCVMCPDHRSHDTVPIEEECEERKALLGRAQAEIQQMIQKKSLKMKEVQHSIEFNKMDAEREIANSARVFTALVASIQSSQTELMEVIKEKQIESEKQAEVFIKELEQEITELNKRSSELEQLSHTEDYLHLLQSSPSLSTPPPTKDWSEVRVRTDLFVGTVRKAVAQLEETVIKDLKELCDAELMRIQQYAVDVTLEPDTAHPNLILSEDGNQVIYGKIRKDLPDNPQRFSRCPCVLGKEGFSSGKFYFEIMLKEKIEWALGVATESINRKGTFPLGPRNGNWTISLSHGNEYRAPGLSLSLGKKPQKVGVFVDYEGGQVSFYDVDNKTQIYSYRGYTFTEKLYPLFFVGCNADVRKTPMVLSCH
ncbi:E3 ubiquitin-protein ligase TRIM58-like [Aplochiton taeniatus]